MPRKTKKQKIIADYRKKLQKLKSPTILVTPSSSTSLTTSKRVKKKRRKAISTETVQKGSHDYNSIKKELTPQTKQITKDLKKTLILSAFAILSLFVVYFVSKFELLG